jgi:hypothetical protein
MSGTDLQIEDEVSEAYDRELNLPEEPVAERFGDCLRLGVDL